MSREEIYQQINKKLGRVPSFFKSLSDDDLESTWRIFSLKLYRRVRGS